MLEIFLLIVLDNQKSLEITTIKNPWHLQNHYKF